MIDSALKFMFVSNETKKQVALLPHMMIQSSWKSTVHVPVLLGYRLERRVFNH